ncbi:D-alanyl-D-alanine carboxypeptidase family protein [Bacillus tianshenii]|nr:D-alanyl-D-alanine carboxypeptidase family protein [Bacillus tianshenii]
MLLIGIFSTHGAKEVHAAGELEMNAKSAILIDADTGKILYALEPDLTLPPASMTKMMTEYLVLDAIKKKQISWKDKVKISDFVYKISQNKQLSNVPLRKDAEYTVEELYEAMAIYSANGATIALAEHIAGSETKFVKKMNEKGKELNLKDYKFVNSTGLNNRDLKGNHPKGTGANEENMLSARATAKLAYQLLNKYPEVLETASIPTKTFRKGTNDAIEMLNWNWMLPNIPGYLQAYAYEGVDGLKTGSTELAGYCFTGTAERDGMRLISVVMGTDSITKRFEETKKMMDYGFENFEKQEVFPANYKAKEKSSVAVEKGKEKSVDVVSAKPLAMVMKKGEKKQYSPKVVFDKLNKDDALVAPIKEGQKVGTLTYDYKGKDEYGYITAKGEQAASVDMVTASSVEKANWFILSIRGIGGFFADIWTSVASSVKGLFS